MYYNNNVINVQIIKFILFYVVRITKLVKKHSKHVHFNCKNVNVADEE